MHRQIKNNRSINNLLRIASMCLLFAVIHNAAAQKCALDIDSVATTYILHLPDGYDKTKTYPLVINFHGLNSQAVKHEEYCQMDKVSDKEGFILVYPQSNHGGWNTGLGFRSYINKHDDIHYFNRLLDTLERTYLIDTKRIYVVGVSLGGTFAYRVACEMSNRIAAIASVSGLMTDSTLIYCNSARSVPVLHMHGTRDHIMRYTGMHQAYGAEELIKIWAFKDGCYPKPDTLHIPDQSKEDKTTAMIIKYTNCMNGSQVWLCKIDKGGHTWPGSAKQFKLMGRKNEDFNGSQAIWDFFKQFTVETGVGLVQK